MFVLFGFISYFSYGNPIPFYRVSYAFLFFFFQALKKTWLSQMSLASAAGLIYDFICDVNVNTGIGMFESDLQSTLIQRN